MDAISWDTRLEATTVSNHRLWVKTAVQRALFICLQRVRQFEPGGVLFAKAEHAPAGVALSRRVKT